MISTDQLSLLPQHQRGDVWSYLEYGVKRWSFCCNGCGEIFSGLPDPLIVGEVLGLHLTECGVECGR